MEFAYNNSYQSSIQMATFGALYGHSCRSPICLIQVDERRFIRTKIIEESSKIM